MSEAELIFTGLAELSTCQIAENINAEGMEENKKQVKLAVVLLKNSFGIGK